MTLSVDHELAGKRVETIHKEWGAGLVLGVFTDKDGKVVNRAYVRLDNGITAYWSFDELIDIKARRRGRKKGTSHEV